MESSFLFLIVGIFIFIAKTFVSQKNAMIQFLTFTGVGLITGTIVGIMENANLIPGLSLPWISGSIIGILSGGLLYLAERINFFFRPGVQYIATTILAMILAISFYLLLILYLYPVSPEKALPFAKEIVFLIFVLYAFIIVFGYTFPKRWFIKHENKK